MQTGNPDNRFSVDAPWNVKIPFDAPRTLIDNSAFLFSGMQIGVVGSLDKPGGQGTGTPILTGTDASPKVMISSQWPGQPMQYTASFPVDGDVSRQLNTNTSSDGHAVFINTDQNVALQTFKTAVDDGQTEYALGGGLQPGFDVSTLAISWPYSTEGIGAEGRCSTNAPPAFPRSA